MSYSDIYRRTRVIAGATLRVTLVRTRETSPAGHVHITWECLPVADSCIGPVILPVTWLHACEAVEYRRDDMSDLPKLDIDTRTNTELFNSGEML